MKPKPPTPAPVLKVREARQNFCTMLAAGKVCAIGDEYKVRGFLVGVQQQDTHETKARLAGLRAARQQIISAIDAEIARIEKRGY